MTTETQNERMEVAVSFLKNRSTESLVESLNFFENAVNAAKKPKSKSYVGPKDHFMVEVLYLALTERGYFD